MFDMTRMRRRVGGIFVCAAAASLGPSPRMTWRSWWSGLKALFSIAPLLFVVTPSIAADVTYKDYTNASSEIWKRGFVLGISQYMAAVAQPDEEAPYPVRNAYQRCLAGSTDVLLVRQIEAYVAKNSVSANEPMVRVVIRALFNLCRSEIEKVKPSKAAPSPQAK
jgi:hypothetical protein